ncbi:hypothetical protein SAMD00023519_01767 [Listeria monocytogenes]|nr:hypothetical protein SAMD00023519_01767 [Listeria monocytogenes]
MFIIKRKCCRKSSICNRFWQNRRHRCGFQKYKTV